MKKYILIAFLFCLIYSGKSQSFNSIFNNTLINNCGSVRSVNGYLFSLEDSLVSGTSDTLFSIPMAADSTVNITFQYGISATDGDTTQGECGILLLSAVNENTTLKYTFSELGSIQPASMLGTLTKTLSCSLASSVLYVIVNVTSSITPTRLKIKYTPDVFTCQILTQL